MAGFFLFHFEDWPIINKNLIVLTKNSTERSLSNWKVYFSKPAKNAATVFYVNKICSRIILSTWRILQNDLVRIWIPIRIRILLIVSKIEKNLKDRLKIFTNNFLNISFISAIFKNFWIRGKYFGSGSGKMMRFFRIRIRNTIVHTFLPTSWPFPLSSSTILG